MTAENNNQLHSGDTEPITPLIYPLSADSSLGNSEEEKSYKTYFRYLDQAFDETRIRNMAVTGDYGIGKSSLIRSYENHCLKKAESIDEGNIRKNHDDCSKGFLYISLGRYEDSADDVKVDSSSDDEAESSNGAEAANRAETVEGAESANRAEMVGEAGTVNGSDSAIKKKSACADADKNEKKDDVNTVERRMLLQIYARFHQDDLPLTSFRMIDENVEHRKAGARIAVFLTTVILLLTFHSQLGKLAETVGLPWLSFWRAPLHLILYAIVIVSASVGVGLLVYKTLPRMRLSGLSLKHDNFELEMEKKACESYLDQYSLELVYCMEQIAEKISRTVVIEDMDRLDKDTCIEVFTQLRQINNLINLRMGDDNYVRFIYIVNNELLANINFSKFFDYTLLVIPALNRKSSENIFLTSLQSVDFSLIKSMPESIHKDMFNLVENDGADGIICQTAPWMRDFRMQHTVLNEYSILFSLYCDNNENVDQEDPVHMLAFAIYKNFWPEDYGKVRYDESSVLPVCNIEELHNWKNYGLLKVLTDPKESFLTARCLNYAGYSEKNLADRFNNMLTNEKNSSAIKVGRIDAIEPDDRQILEVLKEYLKTLNLADDENHKKMDIFHAAIRCMIRCGESENAWLFDKRDIMECLNIIGTMEDELAQKFMALCGADGEHDLYAECGRRKILENISPWTPLQLKAFCMGAAVVHETITIDMLDENDELKEVDLYEEVNKYWSSRQDG